MRKKRFIVLASCGFLGLHAVIYNGSKQASKQASKHEGRYRRSLACACLLAGFIRPGRRPYLFDESRPAVYAKTVCEGRI
jgi:hypothetical protein